MGNMIRSWREKWNEFYRYEAEAEQANLTGKLSLPKEEQIQPCNDERINKREHENKKPDSPKKSNP